MTTSVLVAGGTGDIGARIVRELLHHDTHIRILTRPGSGTARRMYGSDARIDLAEAAYTDPAALTDAVSGVQSVISAVSGVRPVIIDAQRALLAAAIKAGVPRFIPSDYSSDYRQITPGSNRHFELRREFAADLDAAPINGTSVLNGAFTDMLTGQAPMISFKHHRVMFCPHPSRFLISPAKTTPPGSPRSSPWTRPHPVSWRSPVTG